MVQQYESLVGQEVDDMIKKHFEEGIIEGMEEEVAKETHGNADFMTQDMASNVVGNSSTQVQGAIAPNSSLF